MNNNVFAKFCIFEYWAMLRFLQPSVVVTDLEKTVYKQHIPYASIILFVYLFVCLLINIIFGSKGPNYYYI